MTETERQLLSREVNDHIRARFATDDGPDTPLEILCECGTCNVVVPTTLADYDEKRGAGFLVGHD